MSATDQRPNFLFIITDQQRADWLGCAGHPVVRTPHIDALASRGTRFERFYVASPVCMPNRASLMTGRFPTTHGLRYNGCFLPATANTFVDVLKADGYRTASIGKSHLQPFTTVPPVARAPFDSGPIEEAWQKDGHDYWQEQPTRYDGTSRYDFRTPYYGFDHVDMVVGHSDQVDGHYLQWLRAQTPDWDRLRDRNHQLPHNYSCPQAYRTAIPEELYPTAYVRDRACEWLKAQQDADQPFFAFVSFPDPHHPFTPPGRYWDMYDPDEFRVPLPYSRHQNPPMPMRACMELAQAGRDPITPTTAFSLLDERQIREAMALSAGMISMVDDAIGDLTRTLTEAGLTENTVICFNSDHGEYMGDYNLMLKGALSTEGINRVPFIWVEPGQEQTAVSHAMGSTVDISSTVLARAGSKPYFGMQGENLLPCLQGADSERDAVLVEFNDAVPRMGFKTPARVRTLVTPDVRFSIYKDEPWGELYDREVDPEDTHNRFDDPAKRSQRADLALELNHRLIGLMDESPRSERLA
ncbi:MAG: sulfatase-like hydrolase/transferase [Pseudomonadota bacterium]